MSCEYCWNKARNQWGDAAEDYSATLRKAEAEGWPCCERGPDGELTENARRLRAGEYWDDALKIDTRTVIPPRRPPSGAPRP